MARPVLGWSFALPPGCDFHIPTRGFPGNAFDATCFALASSEALGLHPPTVLIAATSRMLTITQCDVRIGNPIFTTNSIDLTESKVSTSLTLSCPPPAARSARDETHAPSLSLRGAGRRRGNLLVAESPATRLLRFARNDDEGRARSHHLVSPIVVSMDGSRHACPHLALVGTIPLGWPRLPLRPS